MARILVVDDEEIIRFTLRQMLQKAGHEVFEAANGHVALKTFEDLGVDLVITDIIMPEKEGIETITEIRRRKPELKIIAVSGSALESGLLLSAARKLGADASLEKPIRRAELLDLVARLMAGQGE